MSLLPSLHFHAGSRSEPWVLPLTSPSLLSTAGFKNNNYTKWFIASFSQRSEQTLYQEDPLWWWPQTCSSCFAVMQCIAGTLESVLWVFQVFGCRNSLPPIPLSLLPYPLCHWTLTAEQWPVPGVAIIEKRDCWLLVERPSVSLSGLVSVAFVGGEVEGYVRARQPPVGSC